LTENVVRIELVQPDAVDYILWNPFVLLCQHLKLLTGFNDPTFFILVKTKVKLDVISAISIKIWGGIRVHCVQLEPPILI